MGRAFPPRPECPDIPDIPAIEGALVNLLQEVSNVPPPAFEFPAFEFPMPNPPPQAFGCYGISMSSRLNEVSGVPIVSSSINPLFEAVIRYPKSSDTGICEPVFDFNVKIPPCAAISLDGQVSMNQTISLPEISISGGRKADAPCASTFNFDFKIPCNTININALVSTVPSITSPEWQVSSRSGAGVCVTDFCLNLRLPLAADSGVCQARMASTEDTSTSGLQTIDGVAGSSGDVVLLKDQTSGETNGAYHMRSGSWDRACDMAGGIVVTVREGDTNGATAWMLTTNDPILVGTTPLEFELISGAACCCYARVATLEDITLSGTQTIDGIALSEGDIVLVKNQTDAKQNGPYIVNSGVSPAWERTCEIVSGHTVNVREGLLQAQTIWMLVTDGEIDLEITELVYQQAIDRPSAKVCTTYDHACSGLTDYHDGVTLSADDVVLVAGQNVPSQNGLYLAKSGSWIRTGSITPGMIIAIREGSVWGGHPFTLCEYATNPIVIGSTTLVFKSLRMVIKVLAALDKGPYGQPGQALSGTPIVDDVTLNEGSVVLVFNSTDENINGIWVADTGDWLRAVNTDADNSGIIIPVKYGTRFGQTSFMITGSGEAYLSIMGITGVVGPGGVGGVSGPP